MCFQPQQHQSSPIMLSPFPVSSPGATLPRTSSPTPCSQPISLHEPGSLRCRLLVPGIFAPGAPFLGLCTCCFRHLGHTAPHSDSRLFP